MHRFFVEPKLLKGAESIALPDKLAHQVRDVLHLVVGEQVVLLDNSGDEVLAEWSPRDGASVESAQATLRRWLEQDYEAVQSRDGVHYEPLADDELPVNAAQVILSTAMGGG